MTQELMSLVYVSGLTAVLWVPYILNTLMVRGIMGGVGYPTNPEPLAPWAQRAKAAHYNAVENLVVFVALVLTANAAGISNETTVLACNVYVWARLVHYVVYLFAIPWLRTLSFATGWACQFAIIWQIIA